MQSEAVYNNQQIFVGYSWIAKWVHAYQLKKLHMQTKQLRG